MKNQISVFKNIILLKGSEEEGRNSGYRETTSGSSER